MRILALLAAGLLAQAIASDTSEAAQAKRKRPGTTQSGKAWGNGPSQRAAPRSGGDYYENLLDSQRFGSQRWWEIYGRQRGSPI